MSNIEKYALGVIHGRFQVLHNDHISYIESGLALCRHLVIGITNPDPGLTAHESSDINRGARESNPLTYYERYLCIQAAMRERGHDNSTYSIVPFPIGFPELYEYYVPIEAVFFITIYDDWGRAKLERFTSLGLTIHVLRDVMPEEKGLSASTVREQIIAGKPWHNLVPRAVALLLDEWKIAERLHTLK